ncbi:isoprenyl transferase [Akkermansiaceae bacterium]|nr:isoprenyl transferase [Akkermansiaceae bacterium]MDB4106772.1 isoprenyl transferase [bacterium]MDA7649212.1 isoprenyl transferase [Akkermansiaceae bacterium]MDA7684227.1 isoprenyl transferase [Akkermansiaceae bacterium]MDA7863060.1 isoprenyl transferase [Akkermansiaceae bacterium]
MPEASDSVPRHIAVIMDGNGRWAKERGLPRKEGHQAGAEAVREAVDACAEMGVKYLTLYAFSSENWDRPKAEVGALMALLERFLKTKAREIGKQNVRLKAIGRLDMLPARTQKALDRTITDTAANDGLTLVLALSYGSREEIVDATKAIAERVHSGELLAEEITREVISNHLYTSDCPDPDLLIRTSGEFRLSNFLLWQLSYAEIFISLKNWPDFKKSDFHEAVADYARRHRRFGRL